MAEIYKQTTREIWDLYIEGLTNLEMQKRTGYTINMIASAISRGRKAGVLPDRYFKQPLVDRRNTRTRRGTISDVIDNLTHEQNKWLIKTAQKYECDSLSELITEFVRDTYEAESKGA